MVTLVVNFLSALWMGNPEVIALSDDGGLVVGLASVQLLLVGGLVVEQELGIRKLVVLEDRLGSNLEG